MQIVLNHKPVFEFVRQGHGDQSARIGFEGVGHVVVNPITEVVDAIAGEQVGRVARLVTSGAKPAGNGLPR